MSYRSSALVPLEKETVVFCRDCKWLARRDGDTGILWNCEVPTGYISTVTGTSEMRVYECEKRNADGDCPTFELRPPKKKPWWRFWR